jgi:hypothetical protein
MILLLLQKCEESNEKPKLPRNLQSASCPNCGSKALAASVGQNRWLDAFLLIAGVASFQCRVCNEHFRSPGDFEVRIAGDGLSVRARCH